MSAQTDPATSPDDLEEIEHALVPGRLLLLRRLLAARRKQNNE